MATRAPDWTAILEERIRRAFVLDRFEIRVNAERTMLQVLIDDRTFLLNEVGTGIAQYILVGANRLLIRARGRLLTSRKATSTPGIQGDFLEMVEEYAEGGVVYSTHSLGLATNFSRDCQIAERLADGTTWLHPLNPGSPRASFMRSLLYSGFLDTGADVAIMVEGSHDINPTRAFLRTLRKRHRGAVLPFSGDAVLGRNAEGYLDDLLRIVPANRLIFIMDSERANQGNAIAAPREAFRSACEVRGIPCLVTERRAFENYLCGRAVKAAKGEGDRGLEPFERLNPQAPDLWIKPENGSIAAEMNRDEILATDLGRFLNAHVAAVDTELA